MGATRTTGLNAAELPKKYFGPNCDLNIPWLCIELLRTTVRSREDQLKKRMSGINTGLSLGPSNMTRRSNNTPRSQIYVDELYKLLQASVNKLLHRDSMLSYRKNLLTLCQNLSILPTHFTSGCLHLIDAQPVGVGATATVISVPNGTSSVAVKLFRQTNGHARKSFIKEALLLESMHHPNIISFRGVINSNCGFGIIMPLMENGNICNYLTRNPRACRKTLVIQIVKGLYYLQKSCYIIHGDLKGANILIDDGGNACIADFGLATYYPDNSLEETIFPAANYDTESPYCAEETYSDVGTWRYMSPERLSPDESKSARPTFESDVFSLGMVIYEVYSGHVPFHNVRNCMALLEIIKNKRPERDFEIPDIIWSLTEDCWRAEPLQRPHIGNIMARLSEPHIV